MASFGPANHSYCGKKPAGFTRLTPEVLDWVRKTAGINDHGIDAQGEGFLPLPSTALDAKLLIF